MGERPQQLHTQAAMACWNWDQGFTVYSSDYCKDPLTETPTDSSLPKLRPPSTCHLCSLFASRLPPPFHNVTCLLSPVTEPWEVCSYLTADLAAPRGWSLCLPGGAVMAFLQSTVDK